MWKCKANRWIWAWKFHISVNHEDKKSLDWARNRLVSIFISLGKANIRSATDSTLYKNRETTVTSTLLLTLLEIFMCILQWFRLLFPASSHSAIFQQTGFDFKIHWFLEIAKAEAPSAIQSTASLLMTQCSIVSVENNCIIKIFHIERIVGFVAVEILFKVYLPYINCKLFIRVQVSGC